MSRYDDDDDIGRSSRRRDRGDDDAAGEADRFGEVPIEQESIGLSVTSMVLGIVSLVIMIVFGFGATCIGGILFCCCPLAPSAGAFIAAGIAAIPAILAIILGYIGMGQGGRGYAITGMVLGGVTLLLGIALAGLFFVFGAAIFGAAVAAPPPPQNPGPQPFPRQF